MDDHIILKLEIARLLRIQREQQLAECNNVIFQALVCISLIQLGYHSTPLSFGNRLLLYDRFSIPFSSIFKIISIVFSYSIVLSIGIRCPEKI